MLDFDPVFYEAAFFDDLDLDGSISMIAQDEQYFITVILGEFDPGKAESPNGRPIPGYKGIITESDPDYWGCQNCIIIDSLDGPSYFALEGIVQVTAINLAEETGSFHLHHVYAKEIENQAQEGESSDYVFSDPGRILCLESLLIESSE